MNANSGDVFGELVDVKPIDNSRSGCKPLASCPRKRPLRSEHNGRVSLMFDLLRRLAGCTSGAATLEAAIVLPVAISLMVGGVEFGNLFLTYGTAAKSVRDAARYLPASRKRN